MKHRTANTAEQERTTSPQPAPQTWKLLATQLRHLDQRLGMGADVPDAGTLPHLRVLIRLEDADTGAVVALPPRLHHRLRPGPSERACLELLAPKTERGQAFVRGLRLAWSGLRASAVAPLWEAMNVDVRGRGTLEAGAGVLAAWAAAFPDAIVTVTEADGADQEKGGGPEHAQPVA